jgi:hypothetical protein
MNKFLSLKILSEVHTFFFRSNITIKNVVVEIKVKIKTHSVYLQIKLFGSQGGSVTVILGFLDECET